MLPFCILVPRINISDEQKQLSQEDGAGGGVEHGTKEVQEKTTYQLPPPLKDDIPDIPENFLSKLKSLPKSQQRRTAFDLIALLEEEDLIQEIEDER